DKIDDKKTIETSLIGVENVKCPQCNHKNSRVLDSRPIEEGDAIRRRRECEQCGFRFTTFERSEEMPLIIVKKDGTRQEFEHDKFIRDLIIAFKKSPVTINTNQQLAIDVEKEIRSSEESEKSSNEIGEMVLERLLEIDEIDYIRFASVYRQYKNVNVLLDEFK